MVHTFLVLSKSSLKQDFLRIALQHLQRGQSYPHVQLNGHLSKNVLMSGAPPLLVRFPNSLLKDGLGNLKYPIITPIKGKQICLWANKRHPGPGEDHKLFTIYPYELWTNRCNWHTDTFVKWNSSISNYDLYDQLLSIYVAVLQWHYLGCSHPDRVTLIWNGIINYARRAQPAPVSRHFRWEDDNDGCRKLENLSQEKYWNVLCVIV